MSIPKNLSELYDKNTALLECMNFTPGKDDPANLCNRESYSESGLFTETMIASIFGDTTELDDSAGTSVFRNIGMLLIRPDMMHVTSQFESYIRQRFEIIHSDNVTMDSASYWEIYRHDLHRMSTMHSRLTRAAIYIGSQCRLIIFRDIIASERPLADRVRGVLKGKQGVFQQGTIRGDIVYRNAMRLDYHRINDKRVSSAIKTAIDPFGVYRMLSKSSTGEHVGLVHPLLFYTGVGVHIPDATEIETDLPQFLDEQTKKTIENLR